MRKRLSGNAVSDAIRYCGRSANGLKRTGIAPASSKLGEAIAYALKKWHALERYLDDWQLTPDNNSCERGIRPFVMRRKNWAMSGSPAGAKRSCELYTLIETAKANDWNPLKYLTKVFQKAAAMKPSDGWSQLLPWNLTPKNFFQGVVQIDGYLRRT